MIRLILFLTITSACTADHAREIIKSELPPVKVKVHTVNRKTVTRKIIGEGIVKPHRIYKVHAGGSGQFQAIYSGAGDWVNRGDTLAVMDDHRQRMAVRSARIMLEKSAYLFESEKLGFSEGGDVPDTVIRALELSSGLLEARLALEKAMRETAGMVVISPVSGVLVEWTVVPGQAVVERELLGQIFDMRDLRLEVYLPETDLRLAHPGMRGRGVSLAGDSIHCILKQIIPHIDEKGRFKTIWTIEDPADLVTGQHCTLEGDLELRKGIFVPKAAVVRRGSNTTVFVARQDTARWVNVETGWYSENQVEIISGLEEGDKVIISGLFALHEGAPLEIE